MIDLYKYVVYSNPPLLYFQLHMLCQAYEKYANGLSRSNSLLRELRGNQDFMNFIREPCSDSAFSNMTLSTFINRPVQHIQSLYSALGDLLTSTSPDSADFSPLQQIVVSMSHCVAAVSMPGHRVQQLSTDSAELTCSQDSLASTCSSEAAQIQTSCDPQVEMVAQIQDRLSFSPNVPVSAITMLLLVPY